LGQAESQEPFLSELGEEELGGKSGRKWDKKIWGETIETNKAKVWEEKTERGFGSCNIKKKKGERTVNQRRIKTEPRRSGGKTLGSARETTLGGFEHDLSEELGKRDGTKGGIKTGGREKKARKPTLFFIRRNLRSKVSRGEPAGGGGRQS